MSHAREVVLSGLRFLEAPRWHDGRIWVSDIYGQRVYSAAEDGSDLRVEAEIDGLPSGLGWLPDGRLLIALTGHAYRVLRREPDGQLSVHATVGPEHGPLCDMVVAADGSAYIGAFGFDAAAGAPIQEGVIYRVTSTGDVSIVAENLLIPNGMVIRDDATLTVNESIGNRITEFDLNSDGTLTSRRTIVRFGPPPTSRSIADVIPGLTVTPDGCTADAKGALWIADPERNRALRIRPDGTITDTVTADVEIFACTLGGPDGRTLFLCAAPDSRPSARLEAHEGQLLAVRVQVPHAGRP